MAESYFEMLTEQHGIPAKPFDPVEELKRLRRGLTLRMQMSKSAADEIAEPPTSCVENAPEIIDTKETVSSPSYEAAPPEAEPIPQESVSEKIDKMKTSLVIWQRSRIHTRSARNDIFRGNSLRIGRNLRVKRHEPLVVSQYLTTPQEGTLETINAGLMALGIVSIVFGVLCFYRGLESDLSIGSLVCATGAAIVLIGLGGRFLVSLFDISNS